MDNQRPLDPRLNATEITELGSLSTAEVTLKLPKLARLDAQALKFSAGRMIIEEIDYTNVPMTGAFCVGDAILKINNSTPQSADRFRKALLEASPCTVTVSRRAFASAPGEARLRKSLNAMGLPYQKGFSYQVIKCKKETRDRFLAASFGFIAEDVTLTPLNASKFVIGEINSNTAAEKYFSVGDALLDFAAVALRPARDVNALRQFNATFQSGVEMDVLVERPVTREARAVTEGFIKKHLMRHDTPQMNEDAVAIGTQAALYHHWYWRRMVPISITVRPPPPAPNGTPNKKNRKPSKKKNKITSRLRQPKKSKSKDDLTTAEQRTSDEGSVDSGKRVTLHLRKSFQEISTDVTDGTELETVGYRYSSDEDTDEDDEDEGETSARKKAKAAPAVPAKRTGGLSPVVVPYVKKEVKKKSKKKTGLFSSFFQKL